MYQEETMFYASQCNEACWAQSLDTRCPRRTQESRPRAGFSHRDLPELPSSPAGGTEAAMLAPGFQRFPWRSYGKQQLIQRWVPGRAREVCDSDAWGRVSRGLGRFSGQKSKQGGRRQPLYWADSAVLASWTQVR